ncbi:MAG: acyl-CoA synthetase [Rhodobacteraceae bacterium]|nr:MAG: acyl-CoA synthetase [Paracoccaceae bacterium]
MRAFRTLADIREVEAESPYDTRALPATVYQALEQIAAQHGPRPAISFQMFSTPGATAQTLTWADLLGQVRQAANLFHSLGLRESDTVAFILPTLNETAVTLLGGMTAAKVAPINPLLEPAKIGALLRETGARAVVTLRAFPKTDVAQKVAEAVALAPQVETVLELDLLPFLSPPKSWIVPLIRPRIRPGHKARVLDFRRELARQPKDRLIFDAPQQDRIAALFHTGGTTGMPKLAQHRFGGMIYNGWLGGQLLFTERDVLLCPLPLFHVFAAYPILMSCIMSGAHMVLPTPMGYRGEGVFDNFWKLVARWEASFMITVPTALSVLMQRKVDADISSLRTGISGSAALPRELYRRFEEATGVQIAEGYGLTEATCLVSCNPVHGDKKVGSIGLPLPYTQVSILREDTGRFTPCAIDEVGEICIRNPGVTPPTYTDDAKNAELYTPDGFLRTGDLGKLDADGYLWITGRQKDLIIRGGHNIDPAEIEDALLSHPAVSFVGAIGQPDPVAGEMPCAYVELVAGMQTTPAELTEHAKAHISERAALPKHIEILPELPKTAIGKVFKPDLRRMAIARVLDAAFASAGIAAQVTEVIEDRKRGLVARISLEDDGQAPALQALMDSYTLPWDQV